MNLRCDICNSPIVYCYTAFGNDYYKCKCSNGKCLITYWQYNTLERFIDIVNYLTSIGYSVEFIKNQCLLHKDNDIIVGKTANLLESLYDACRRIK